MQERPRQSAQAQPPRPPRMDSYGVIVGLTPGFMKLAPVAWFASLPYFGRHE